jgi:AcrR family transcriptional regulator
MAPRPYKNQSREEAAAQTRARIVEAALTLLREGAGPSFSLEDVAKTAGVTRLTVYNQLGSRRALLEAVFDDVARRGGLHRIAQAMALEDPHATLDALVNIFCDFWSIDHVPLARLHDAAATDPEFTESLASRHERRRMTMATVAERMVKQGDIPARSAADLADMLFVLTSLPVYSQLVAKGRSKASALKLIKAAVDDAVRRAG